MNAVEKISVPHRENLMEPIHMQLCQELKNFVVLFCIFEI